MVAEESGFASKRVSAAVMAARPFVTGEHARVVVLKQVDVCLDHCEQPNHKSKLFLITGVNASKAILSYWRQI